MRFTPFLIVALFPLNVFADGADQHRSPEATPNQASDASFDKRLPPVLPGEHLSDGNKKMKVWSTAGPVPVASEPEPWGDQAGVPNVGAVGVIVDRREEEHHK